MSELFARIEDLDLSQRLTDAEQERVVQALGRHGVLCFSRQTLTSRQLHDFSSRFGTLEINVGGMFQDPELPEVMILSNIVRDGKPIGIGDAGQDWHTDMSYRDVMGFVNVLYGLKIPRRDGKALGGTEFSNMQAAYEALPQDIKHRLDGMTATHDFEKFWENMRQNHASGRPALTEEQRRRRPAVVHPVFLTHPITGKKSLYTNIGYTIRINELPEKESDEMLDFLFRHQLEERFRYTHEWNENDLLIWDNLGTIHRAIADYRPDEIRLMRRCQVLATKAFNDDFLRPAREAAAA
jgi:taurine dioxygenase